MQQREIPVLGETKKLKDVPMALLEMCDDELDAVRLCIQLSKFSHEFIAKQLGIDKGHFSRVLQGQAHFPTTKRLALMGLCGNRAPIQYEAMHLGCKLIESYESRVNALEEGIEAAKEGRVAA